MNATQRELARLLVTLALGVLMVGLGFAGAVHEMFRVAP